jgi:hypothetical protein
MTSPSVTDDSVQELLQDTLCLLLVYVSVRGGLTNAYGLLDQELFFSLFLFNLSIGSRGLVPEKKGPSDVKMELRRLSDIYAWDGETTIETGQSQKATVAGLPQFAISRLGPFIST